MSKHQSKSLKVSSENSTEAPCSQKCFNEAIFESYFWREFNRGPAGKATKGLG